MRLYKMEKGFWGFGFQKSPGVGMFRHLYFTFGPWVLTTWPDESDYDEDDHPKAICGVVSPEGDTFCTRTTPHDLHRGWVGPDDNLRPVRWRD